MSTRIPQVTVLPTLATETGKNGETGVFQITNTEFIAAVFSEIPSGAFAAVCSKSDDPSKGGWLAQQVNQVGVTLPATHNNFIAYSSFEPGENGSFRATKDRFAACHFVMLDDLGSKVPRERLADFELSWEIETSPGNYQGGIILTDPLPDMKSADLLINALIHGGLCDPGARGPTRWARLPEAINGKKKYRREDGKPFQCRLIRWNPEARYTPEEILERLQLELPPTGRAKKRARTLTHPAYTARGISNEDDVLTPKPAQNPVVAALHAHGLYKSPLGSGKHDITCPWVSEHTDALDNGAAYWEPSELYPTGGYCCQHGHGDKYRIRALLEFLGVHKTEARHKPVIRVVAGELPLVVDFAEVELANGGQHYQAGGLIVSVTTDPTTGDPKILPTSLPALTRALANAVTWERFDKREKNWVRCDPPERHAKILHDGQSFRHLPALSGLARQPYFRESDGEIVTEPGYDKASHRFGVFDPRQYIFPEPTLDEARAALAMQEDLLREFRFVAPEDKAAALSAMFTAVVRPSLPYAPAFHVRAPVFGSGKTYLCELIGAFAGPAGNDKVSYPTTSEEATKVILSLLLTSPAVIEFDDMDTDWIPHGIIKRVLTAESVTERVLGQSKTATVSTRTLFLGSGNNVGPVRDLLRRVLEIHIDPRCATPATMSYEEAPVAKVRQNRGKYVSAVLTIIQAWRRAGMPRGAADNIVNFDGAWSDYCRYPLMWLGHPDPATALLDQVRHDPDGDALGGLMSEWFAAFGSTPMTVRKVIDRLKNHPDLDATIRELPVEERGEINPRKLGWFLKKNANRIIKELEIQSADSDGRVAWRVVPVKTPVSPLSPVLTTSVEKTVTGWSGEV